MLSLDLIISHGKNYGFSTWKFGSEITECICSFCIISSESLDIYAAHKPFFSVQCSSTAEFNLSVHLLWQCINVLQIITQYAVEIPEVLWLVLNLELHTFAFFYYINPLSMKLYLSDLKTQFVPRRKHSLPWL